MQWQLKKVNLETGAVTTLDSPTYNVPNGLVLDQQGRLLVCQQGNKTQDGFIQRIDLKTLKRSVVADNWFGVPFNSPNDAEPKRDGSIWFTDTSYGYAQGFRTAPKLNNQVYRISAAGVVDAMADGFTQPNGLAFSDDEKRLYVTDTGILLGYVPQSHLTNSPQCTSHIQNRLTRPYPNLVLVQKSGAVRHIKTPLNYSVRCG